MKEDTSGRVRSHLQKPKQSKDFIQSDGVKDLEKREAKFCSAAAMLAGNLGEHFRKSNIIRRPLVETPRLADKTVG